MVRFTDGAQGSVSISVDLAVFMVYRGAMNKKRTCKGPVYFADQGIEVCEACNGCLCCDFDKVDHSKAFYRCWKNSEGECFLVGNKYHSNHVCE